MVSTNDRLVESLKEAHVALLADLRELDKAARSSPNDGLAQLRHRLDAAQTHVAEHFRMEEVNGYMDAVRKREPRLEHTINQLADEHRQLRQSLDSLVVGAWNASELSEPLCANVRKWIEQLRQHELRENDLVQDALYLDIGAED